MQLYWTRKQVLKRLLSSYQVQLTLGSSEALNDLPQQKHKRDNQRVRITQRVGRAIIKLPASINEKKQVRRNPLIQPCVPGLPEVRLGTAATVCYLEWNFRYRKPNGKHTGELKSWAPQWPGIFHAPCWFWTILIRCSDWCPMNWESSTALKYIYFQPCGPIIAQLSIIQYLQRADRQSLIKMNWK